MRVRAILCASLLAAPSLVEAQPRSPSQPQRYTVRPGDTCVAISRHFYGDSRNTALIHQANPSMGPPPHHLRAGTVLVIPPRREGANTPDALLTAVHNAVEVRAQSVVQGRDDVASRPGRPNDPLYRGNRVNTQERSSAEVTFADETQLQLAERTLIVILGETSTRVRRDASANDTVLERGTLSAFLAGLDRQRGAAALPAVSTDAARLTFDRGTEARIEVDDRRRSTLAVYRGGSRVSAHHRQVRVPQGYGVRAVRDQRIPNPRLLPLAPVWVTRPSRLALIEGDDGTLVGEVAAGDASAQRVRAGERVPAPSRWHVEVAQDARFNELVADVRGAAAQTRIEIPRVPPGSFFMRVSAVDDDGFQGPPSAVVATTVARVSTAVDGSGARTVNVSSGLFCGLDGAPLAAVADRPTALDRRRAHTLRCAVDAEGGGAVERAFEATRLGPLRVDAAMRLSDARQRTASVRVRVFDATGAAVPREGLRVESTNASVLVGDLNPVEGSAGEYDVALMWTRGARAVALRALFDEERAESASLTLPEEPAIPPTPVVPSDRWVHRLSARVEGGAAVMLSEFQRNTDPTAFDGNAPALSWGFGGAARAGVQLLHPEGGTRGAALALEVGGAYWRFPAGAGSTLDRDFAALSIAQVGLRLEPFAGRLRPYVDAHGGVALTGGEARFAFDVGLGLDVPLGPAFSLGPFARYSHVAQTGDLVTDEDARLLSLGLAFSLRPPSARW